MTLKYTGSSNVSTFRHLARAAAATLLAGTLVAGCGGGGDKEAAAAARAAKRAKAEATADNSGTATPPASAADKQARLADAVVDGKSTAPVDMKYEVLAKPAVGVPFEVELTFVPRLPAESIDVEITEATGLTVVGERTAQFTPVESGQNYTSKVLVQGDKPGLYYLGVVAKVSTQALAETRAFAVPVVIGNPPASQKAAPATDATGQAIQSMPAKEPK